MLKNASLARKTEANVMIQLTTAVSNGDNMIMCNVSASTPGVRTFCDDEINDKKTPDHPVVRQ